MCAILSLILNYIEIGLEMSGVLVKHLLTNLGILLMSPCCIHTMHLYSALFQGIENQLDYFSWIRQFMKMTKVDTSLLSLISLYYH